MTQNELQDFLKSISAAHLNDYLDRFAPDPIVALEQRLQWATWSFRDPKLAPEANFLMRNHAALRSLLEADQPPPLSNRTATPAPVNRRKRSVLANLDELNESTTRIRPEIEDDRVASDLVYSPPPPSVLNDPPPLSHPPAFASDRPIIRTPPPVQRVKRPPISESVTAVHAEQIGLGESTQRLPLVSGGTSPMPSGLDRTLHDIDPDQNTPPPTSQPANPRLLIALAVGLGLAGLGAIALAAAIVYVPSAAPIENPLSLKQNMPTKP